MPVVEDLGSYLLTGRVTATERPGYTHVGRGIDDAIEAERLGFRRVWLSERYDLKDVGALRLIEDGATITVNGDTGEVTVEEQQPGVSG
jgi:hypothetical protein